MQTLSIQKVKNAIRCHWPRLQEGLLLVALMAVATLIAYEYDIFPNAPGVPTQERVIEPDEMLALAVLLCVCLLVLSWRFLLLHRREMARRIKVDYQQKILLDTALENMSQGLCMFDADGRIMLFNERYAKMMGLPAAWLKGNRCSTCSSTGKLWRVCRRPGGVFRARGRGGARR